MEMFTPSIQRVKGASLEEAIKNLFVCIRLAFLPYGKIKCEMASVIASMLDTLRAGAGHSNSYQKGDKVRTVFSLKKTSKNYGQPSTTNTEGRIQ
jgi:hypothetical protein